MDSIHYICSIPSQKVDSSIRNKCLPPYIIKWIVVSFLLEEHNSLLLSFFSLIMRIYSRVSTKPLPNDAKRLLPVEVHRSKTLFLKKLPIVL